MILWIVAVLASSLVQDPTAKAETVKIKPEKPPAAGDVLKVVAEEKESMWATIDHGERLLRGLKIGKQWWFEATVEVKEANGDDLVLSYWKFDRAVAEPIRGSRSSRAGRAQALTGLLPGNELLLSRASRTSRCQAGEGTASGVRTRSSQSRSRVRSFSSRLILSSGRTTSI